MKKRGEARNLLQRELECRHAGFAAAVAYDRADLIAPHVARDQVGIDQVRSTFAAEAFAAMTKRAVLAKQDLPCSTTAAGDAMLAGLVCAATNAQPASKATTTGTMILNLNSLNSKSDETGRK